MNWIWKRKALSEPLLHEKKPKGNTSLQSHSSIVYNLLFLINFEYLHYQNQTKHELQSKIFVEQSTKQNISLSTNPQYNRRFLRKSSSNSSNRHIFESDKRIILKHLNWRFIKSYKHERRARHTSLRWQLDWQGQERAVGRRIHTFRQAEFSLVGTQSSRWVACKRCSSSHLLKCFKYFRLCIYRVLEQGWSWNCLR